MDPTANSDVLGFFVDEARGYLPAIREGVAAYAAGPGPAALLAEPHRTVHIIKGAAAMLGLADLSDLAHRFEEVILGLADGTLAPTDQTGPALAAMADVLAASIDRLGAGETDHAALREEMVRLDVGLRGPEDQRPVRPIDTPPPFTWAFTDDAPGLDMGETPTPDGTGPGFSAGDLPEPAGTAPPPPDFDFGPDVPPEPGLDGFGDELFAPPPGVAAAPEPGPDIDPEILEVFRLEAEDHLRTITAHLPALRERPGDRTPLREIRRSAHTLKGSAATVGFDAIAKLAHRMEDLLDELAEADQFPTPEVVQLLFESADALEDLSAGKSAPLTALYGRYDLLVGAAPLPLPSAPAPVAARPPAPAPPPPEPAVLELPEEPEAPAERRSGRYVRVPIERLDELVRLVSELVITRSFFEQRMAEFQRLAGELQLSTGRLRRVSNKLDTQYEAGALGGGWLTSRLASEGLNGAGGDGASAFTPPAVPRGGHGFDDLEFDRYTEFHLLTRELSETTTDAQTIGGEFGHLIGDFDGLLTRQGRLASEIEDKLMRLRMVPLASVASRLERTVRNAADLAGKQADLVVEGGRTELDKTVLEEMSDPLLHLLRNAVDHGIESADVRRALGKPERGTVRLSAGNEGNLVVIRVGDDGRGIDAAALRAKAVERGLVSAADAAAMSDDEACRLVFLPGLSTAAAVSELSGRGVGMDVVLSQVQKLKGTVGIESRPGRGTTFVVRLPLTLAVARALLVRANQETFAVPLDAVRQILRTESDTPDAVGPDPVLRVGDKLYPMVSLGAALGLKQPADDVPRRPVVLLDTGGSVTALVVDRLIGAREIVVKSLGSHLRQVRGVLGATLMGDGGVVLILNPADLAAKAAPVREAARPAAAPAAGTTVMVVDDSPSVRRVLTNLLRGAGVAVVPARDGLDALEQLQQSATAPDLILTDIEMPRMDGYELLASLKAEGAFGGIPTVVITSRAAEKHRAKAMALGASAYVVKPYQDQALLELVRQLVRDARLAGV